MKRIFTSSEKRKSPRIDFQSLVNIAHEGTPDEKVSGVSCDISMGGIQIQLPLRFSFSEGDSVNLFFLLKQRSKNGAAVSIKSQGDVQRLSDKSTQLGVYRIGIKFRGLSEDQVAQLFEALDLQQAISEELKSEYEARNREIMTYANNAFLVTTGTITTGITFLGAIVANWGGFKYLSFILLIVFDVGFHLYRVQLSRIRRIGSYIRCILEPRIKNCNWEDDLFEFRRTTHALGNLDRNKFYSLEYYGIAVLFTLITGVCLIIMLASSFPSTTSVWNTVSIRYALSITLFGGYFFGYWCFYRLAHMRSHSKELEGGDKLDKQMGSFWHYVKQKQLGLCSNESHGHANLMALWGTKINAYFDEKLKDDAASCVFSKKCHLNKEIDNLIFSLNKTKVGVKRNHWYVASVILLADLLMIALYDFWRHQNVWAGSLTVFILTTFLIIKFRIRPIFYAKDTVRSMNKKNPVFDKWGSYVFGMITVVASGYGIYECIWHDNFLSGVAAVALLSMTFYVAKVIISEKNMNFYYIDHSKIADGFGLAMSLKFKRRSILTWIFCHSWDPHYARVSEYIYFGGNWKKKDFSGVKRNLARKRTRNKNRHKLSKVNVTPKKEKGVGVFIQDMWLRK